MDRQLKLAIEQQDLPIQSIAVEAARLARHGKQGDSGAHYWNILLAWRCVRDYEDGYMAWSHFIEEMLAAKKTYQRGDDPYLNLQWFGIIGNQVRKCRKCDDFGAFMSCNMGLLDKRLFKLISELCKGEC